MGPTVDRMRSHHRATHTHTCSSHSDGTLETRQSPHVSIFRMWEETGGLGEKPHGCGENVQTPHRVACRERSVFPHQRYNEVTPNERTWCEDLRPCSVFRCLCTRCLTFLLFRSRSAVAYFGFSFPGAAKSQSSLVHSPKTCWHCSSATVSFLFLFLNFIRRFIPFLFFYCRLSEVSHGRC